MKNLVLDLINFIRSLSLLNILFIIAVIVLIVLVVALIYINRINNEVEDEEVVMEIKDQEELDLNSITRALEEDIPKPIVLNDYEKEQEEKAIISYDELIASQKNNKEVINYKEEKDMAGLKVKSVDLNNLTTTLDLPKTKEERIVPILYNYTKEEEFLKALKKLQKSL